MQNNNLLKKAILALLLCVAMPCVNAQVAHIGDILCTNGVYVSPAEYETSGLEAMGVIFYVDATGQHGWAIALQDAGSYTWCTSSVNGGFDTALPNYTNIRQAVYDLDGYENTRIVRQSGYHAAFYAVDFVNGWYLPAIGQLNYLYGNMVEVNAGLVMAGGSVFSSTSGWTYWSSTERNHYYAWTMSSSGGLSGYYSPGGSTYENRKSSSYSVRPARSF